MGAERADSTRLGTVHIGNVAEYNEQFFPVGFRADHRDSWAREGDLYADLALFYSADPGPVFLPLRFDPAWLELQRRHLDWPHLDVHWAISEQRSVCRVLSKPGAARSALLSALRRGAAVAAWGRAPGLDSLLTELRAALGQAPPPVMAPQAEFESKLAADGRFRRCAVARPRFRVPALQACTTAAEAAAAITARVRITGRPVVLKSEFGVGGFGTQLIRPAEAGCLAATTALLDALIEDDAIFTVGALLVQDYVEPAPGPHAQLTYDGEVLADGSLLHHGTAVMTVRETKYLGAAVGPGVLAPPVHAELADFGNAVGSLLAAEGYRGWFDVDFVRTADGLMAPMEINARRTGPTVAMTIAQNLASQADRPRQAIVRTHDLFKLPHPTQEAELLASVEKLQDRLARRGIGLIPTIVSGIQEKLPIFGAAVFGDTIAHVDTAMAELAAELGDHA